MQSSKSIMVIVSLVAIVAIFVLVISSENKGTNEYYGSPPPSDIAGQAIKSASKSITTNEAPNYNYLFGTPIDNTQGDPQKSLVRSTQ